MNNLPTVSIVIPVFNAERFLRETIESLLSQDYPALEIIAVDDGSKDDSLKILYLYKERINVFSQKNSGQSAALNFGWMKSSGKYIGYLSSDDILYPNAISLLVETLEVNQNAIAAYCDYDLIDAKSKIIRNVKSPIFKRQELIETLTCPPGPGLLFKKETFIMYGGWNTELKQMPDFEYWLRISYNNTFFKISATLAAFRIHESSQTFRPMQQKNADEPIKVMRDFLQNEISIDQKTKLYSLARSYILSAQWDIRSGRYYNGMLKYLVAFKYSPKNLLTLHTYRGLLSSFLGRIYYRYFHKT